MPNEHLVSVIINCYNGEEFLRDAIDSVLAQTYENWEIIFWDNQSVDNSASIVNSYNDLRIRYFLAENHTSLGEARNLAFMKAGGEWVGFLDVDDIWFPEKLESNLDKINRSPSSVDLIYSRCEFFSNRTDAHKKLKFLGVYPGARQLPTTNLYKLLFFGNIIPFPSVLYKRKSIETIGGIPPYRFCPDFFLAMSLSREGRVVAINKVLCRYRCSDTSMTARLSAVGWQESIAITKHFSILDGDRSKSKPLIAAYSLRCLWNGNYLEALSSIKDMGFFRFLSAILKLLFVRIKYF